MYDARCEFRNRQPRRSAGLHAAEHFPVYHNVNGAIAEHRAVNERRFWSEGTTGACPEQTRDRLQWTVFEPRPSASANREGALRRGLQRRTEERVECSRQLLVRKLPGEYFESRKREWAVAGAARKAEAPGQWPTGFAVDAA